MKCHLHGLEGEIVISENEAISLKNSGLRGEIDFSDGNEVGKIFRRKIPFNLVYSPPQKNWLEVCQIPDNVYMGEADIITFSINAEFYEIMHDRRNFGDRFYGRGKIFIIIKD